MRPVLIYMHYATGITSLLTLLAGCHESSATGSVALWATSFTCLFISLQLRKHLDSITP